MAALDTSFLVDVDRRVPAAVGLLESMVASGEALIVPAAAALELARGAVDPALAWARLADACTVVGYTDGMAEEHAALARSLERRGRFPGMADFLIATTALSFDERLVAADARAFADFPGLRLRRYR